MPRFPLGLLALLLATTPLAAAGPVDDLPIPGPWATPREAVQHVVDFLGTVPESPCFPQLDGSPHVKDLLPSDRCFTVSYSVVWCIASLECCMTPSCIVGYVEAATGVGLTSQYPFGYRVMLDEDAQGVVSARVDLGAPCGAGPGGG